ncbi:hypothetical protein WJX79_003402 [Trebouxia sp. C0005]
MVKGQHRLLALTLINFLHVCMSQRICDGCRRPRRVCLCAAYPSPPKATSGLVFILQHPLEHRRALATVPLLERSLRDCLVVKDRKFQGGKHIDLDRVLQQVADGALKGFLLFPGPGSQALDAAYVLFAIDGTWQEAKEIYKAVAPRLLVSSSGIQQVQLPCLKGSLDCATLALPGSIASCPTSTSGQAPAQQANDDSTWQGVEPGSWLLRTEPAEGYVTTAEAVARAVALIEADDGSLLHQLLAPLKLMTQLQAKYNPSLQLRLDKQACKERLLGSVK